MTLSLQLYALSLPDFLSSGFHEVSLESEWTQLWWLVRETIRGLHIGFGGLLAAVILMAVRAVGWLSICRRNWTVGLSIVVAPLALCALMVVKGHNLWPRFVFFCAGFIILILVHGVNLVTRRFCRTIMPAAGPRAELCCFVTPLVVILVTSAAMIPKNYALPKQNYTAARDYVEQRLGPSETAVAIGLAGTVFESYYAPDWKCAKTAKQLEMALHRYRRIWLVYTMPIHVRAYHPDIWTLIQREFENERVFPGTLAGGEVFVCKTKRSLSALSPYTELSADAYEKPTDKR
jgi:hypothetical protein